MAQVVQLRIIKVKHWGKPYTATATLTVTDGEMHVEGLISINDFESKDKRNIERFIRRMGFKYYISSYYKNDVRIIEKNSLTELVEV